jgi:predicted RNA-binding Zn-ribbon protein involved in translation (DUF1610 family)
MQLARKTDEPSRQRAVVPVPTARPAKKVWSACPNCSTDLRAKAFRNQFIYTQCPRCGVSVVAVWWQRVLLYIVTIVFAFGLPELLGVWGIALVFAAVLFLCPAAILATFLLFKTIPPRYVRKPGEVITLFRG